MKIALYSLRGKSSTEYTSTIKEMILELEPETEILEIEDQELDEDNWEGQLRIFPQNDIDTVIAIGDTGTFLRAIFLSRDSIPVVSASSERISFFTEITPSNIRDSLALILL
jgi:NAD kinase